MKRSYIYYLFSAIILPSMLYLACINLGPRNTLAGLNTDKQVTQIVSEMHRSLYGSYSGLNLNTYSKSGFELNKGHLSISLDSLGNTEWTLHVDTAITFKKAFPSETLRAKVQYSINCATQNNSQTQTAWTGDDYRIIKASSLENLNPHYVLNGGFHVSKEMAKDQNPCSLSLIFQLNSVIVNEKTGEILGGKSSFDSKEINEAGNKFEIRGLIYYFPNNLARIKIGDLVYKVDLNSGKVNRI